MKTNLIQSKTNNIPLNSNQNRTKFQFSKENNQQKSSLVNAKSESIEKLVFPVKQQQQQQQSYGVREYLGVNQLMNNMRVANPQPQQQQQPPQKPKTTVNNDAKSFKVLTTTIEKIKLYQESQVKNNVMFQTIGKLNS